MWSVLGGKKRGPRPYPGLITPGEQRVLDLLRAGMTNPQIAARLGISPDGVKYHVSNMLSKLGFERREQLAAWDGEEQRPAAFPWWGSPAGERIAGGAVLAVVAASVLALLAWATPGDGNHTAAVSTPRTYAGDPVTLAGPSGSGWVVDAVRWEGPHVAVYYYPTDANGQAAIAITVGTTLVGAHSLEMVGVAPNGLALVRVLLGRKEGADAVTFSPGPLDVFVAQPYAVLLREGPAGDYTGTAHVRGVDLTVIGSVNERQGVFEVRFAGDLPPALNPVSHAADVELRDAAGRRYPLRSISYFDADPAEVTFDGRVPPRAGTLTLWVAGPEVAEPIPDLAIPLSAVDGTPP